MIVHYVTIKINMEHIEFVVVQAKMKIPNLENFELFLNICQMLFLKLGFK